MAGLGRGTLLNFQDLAGLLTVARQVSFSVRSLSESTGRYPDTVRGFQSWAMVLGLIEDNTLTWLANMLLDLDPLFAQTLTRGICYIELLANPHAEVASHVCRAILPRYALHGWEVTAQDIASNLISDGIGLNSRSNKQPQRDVSHLLNTLQDPSGFGRLGVLRRVTLGRYRVGQSNQGALLTSYAIRRWWPKDRVYLRRDDVFRLVAPLFLPRPAFNEHLSELERRGQVIRITSSGLDQVRPIGDIRIEDIIGLLPGEICWSPSLSRPSVIDNTN